MNGLEERIAKIEGIVSQINERLNHLGDEIMGLRGEITSIRGEITNSRNWTIGLIITMWVTIMLAVFFT